MGTVSSTTPFKIKEYTVNADFSWSLVDSDGKSKRITKEEQHKMLSGLFSDRVDDQKKSTLLMPSSQSQVGDFEYNTQEQIKNYVNDLFNKTFFVKK